MQQGIGTNHESLQMHENNPKSLQKQHGYKYTKTQYTKKHLKYININQSNTGFKRYNQNTHIHTQEFIKTIEDYK